MGFGCAEDHREKESAWAESKGLEFMMRHAIKVQLTAAIAMLATSSLAQRAVNWRVYRLADGLPESGCVSVTLTPQGRVVARHMNDSVASELDGYTISTVPVPEGSSR